MFSIYTKKKKQKKNACVRTENQKHSRTHFSIRENSLESPINVSHQAVGNTDVISLYYTDRIFSPRQLFAFGLQFIALSLAVGSGCSSASSK